MSHRVDLILSLSLYFSSHLILSLFIKKQENLHIIILLYMVDMIINDNSIVDISKLCGDLSFRFEIKVLEELNIFVI